MHTEMECGRSCARARSNLNAGVQRFSASSSGVSPQGSQCGQQLCLLRGPSSSLWHCRHGQWFQALKGIQGSNCSWFWCVQWWWKMICKWIHESHTALVGQSRKTNWRKENHHLKDVQNDYINVKCEILVFSKKYRSWVPKAVLSFNSAKLIFSLCCWCCSSASSYSDCFCKPELYHHSHRYFCLLPYLFASHTKVILYFIAVQIFHL